MILLSVHSNLYYVINQVSISNSIQDIIVRKYTVMRQTHISHKKLSNGRLGVFGHEVRAFGKVTATSLGGFSVHTTAIPSNRASKAIN